MKRIILIIAVALLSNTLLAQHSSPIQSNLSRFITVNIKDQRLEDVLTKISKQGNFYFSYGGEIPKDSIVSISVQHLTIRDVLDQLFKGKVDYKESGKYIILRLTTKRFSMAPESIISGSRYYQIDGYVIDEASGEKVNNASVYEKHLLQSTLTDENGYFKLKFRGEHESIILTASKEMYRDTSILFLSSLKINPQGYPDKDETIGSASNLVERLGLGRFLVSSRQRIQSLNIPGFLANSPFQASFLPGISSHGMLSSQVVNKGSLNVLGGYTAGVDGVEVAGIFNINKKDMKKVQVGGVMNIVGGAVTGVQVGGVMNTVLDSVKGVQVGGVLNDVRQSVDGVQVGGVFNRVKADFKGAQIAGVVNLLGGELNGAQVGGVVNAAAQSVSGVQIAGVVNVAAKKMDGIQVSVLNYAKQMDGVQVGLFNLADTSSGYSIGLFNLVRKGYHKISFYSNEVMNCNASIKTGNSKLYSIWLAGMNISDTAKISSAGFGMGHDFLLAKKLSVSTEISSQFLYLGNWDKAHILNRAQANLQLKLIKGVRVFAGPSYSVYYSDPAAQIANRYKKHIGTQNIHSYSDKVTGWLGFNAGITLF